MAKFPEADARLMKNVFVCKKCSTKRKAPNMKVIAGKVSCRNCGSHKLRPARKK